jgi:hypothetical protein
VAVLIDGGCCGGEGLVGELVQDAGVQVGGGGELGVAEDFLDDFHVHSCG